MRKKLRKRGPNAGISRIDQVDNHTHGFFVRLIRKGTVHSAFFADRRMGGKKLALKAAREHYQKLLAKHGTMSRREWAETVRRKGKSGITGVRRGSRTIGGVKYWFWVATWSPKPYLVKKQMFSVVKFGEKEAKALAIKARKAGLAAMED